MKKIMTFIFAAAVLCTVASAEEKATVQVVKPAAADSVTVVPENEWDFLDFNVFPGVPKSSDTSRVYGIKLSPTVSAGTGCVYGVEMAAFSCMTEQIKGTQLAPAFNSAKKNQGMQASVVNVAEKMEGLQLGLVNVSQSNGFQIGLVNIIKDGWLPFCPVLNFSF